MQGIRDREYGTAYSYPDPISSSRGPFASHVDHEEKQPVPVVAINPQPEPPDLDPADVPVQAEEVAKLATACVSNH